MYPTIIPYTTDAHYTPHIRFALTQIMYFLVTKGVNICRLYIRSHSLNNITSTLMDVSNWSNVCFFQVL